MKQRQDSFAIGVFPTLELLKFQKSQVVEIYLHSKGDSNSGVQKIKKISADFGIKVTVNDAFIKKISHKENVYAVGRFKKYEQHLGSRENHLVLVNPSTAGNLGTIMRTMLGFNLRELAIIRPAVHVFDPKVVRASMGAMFALQIKYFDSFKSYQRNFPNHHLYPFMTSGEIELSRATLKKPWSLVFGSEASGLLESFKDIGQSIRIAHSSQIDSLNLEVAVGIALYELSEYH